MTPTPLLAAMKDPQLASSYAPRQAIVEIGPPALEYLVAALKDANPEVRRSAVAVLGGIKDADAVESPRRRTGGSGPRDALRRGE